MGTTYQLHVISRDFFNTIVYEGPHKGKNKLYLYHVDNHYSVITSMPAIVEWNYYCDNCHVGYNNLGGHVCKQGWKCCQAQTACTFQKRVSCPSCRRSFVSDMCYQTHLTSCICNVVCACNDSGNMYHIYNKHVCGMVFCKVCRDHQPQDHICFI